jgi:hypothetical protein
MVAFAVLTALLMLFGACCKKLPKPECFIIKPPCTLGALPIKPILTSIEPHGKGVCMDEKDARALWVYMARVHAWMVQAKVCGETIKVDQ